MDSVLMLYAPVPHSALDAWNRGEMITAAVLFAAPFVVRALAGCVR